MEFGDDHGKLKLVGKSGARCAVDGDNRVLQAKMQKKLELGLVLLP